MSLLIDNISKAYQNKQVFKECSLNLNDYGNIIGLVGENGCGKSTLFKLISGLSFIDLGTLSNSFKTSKLIENPGFMLNKSGQDNLDYLLNKEELSISNSLIKRFQMADYIKNKVKTYSLGMKQKLSLVIVLSKESNLILLDEPTLSLDVLSVSTLINIIKELSKTKKIMISTHDMPSWYDVFDDIILFKDQKLIKNDIKTFKLTQYLISVKDMTKFREAFKHLIDQELSSGLDSNHVVIKFNPTIHQEIFEEIIKFGLIKAVPITSVGVS